MWHMTKKKSQLEAQRSWIQLFLGKQVITTAFLHYYSVVWNKYYITWFSLPNKERGQKITHTHTHTNNISNGFASMDLKFWRFSEHSRLRSAVEILTTQLLQSINMSSVDDGKNSNLAKFPIRKEPLMPHISSASWARCKDVLKQVPFFSENRKCGEWVDSLPG